MPPLVCIGVLGPEPSKSASSSDIVVVLLLLAEVTSMSDEPDKLRPGMAGRKRGERREGGLKERAKLAMLAVGAPEADLQSIG